jgi:uncharacterized membrane protein YgcG
MTEAQDGPDAMDIVDGNAQQGKDGASSVDAGENDAEKSLLEFTAELAGDATLPEGPEAALKLLQQQCAERVELAAKLDSTKAKTDAALTTWRTRNMTDMLLSDTPVTLNTEHKKLTRKLLASLLAEREAAEALITKARTPEQLALAAANSSHRDAEDRCVDLQGRNEALEQQLNASERVTIKLLEDKMALTAKTEAMAAEIAKLQEDNDSLLAKNRSMEDTMNVVSSKSDAENRKLMVSSMSKPPTYEGKGAGVNSSQSSARDWIAIMRRYTKIAGLTDELAVAFAATYLRGEAARHWDRHCATIEPTLDAFFECLEKRFDGKQTETEARRKLLHLKQQNKLASLTRYIAEFDRLLTFITDMSDKDKIFQFMEGLTSNAVKQHLSSDPATGKPYLTFDALHDAAENVAAVLQDAMSGYVPQASQERKRGSSSGGGGGSKGGSSSGGGGNTQPSKKAKTAPQLPTTVTGSDKKTVQRGDAVIKECKSRGLCLRCFGQGHRARDCSNDVAEGHPPPAKGK